MGFYSGVILADHGYRRLAENGRHSTFHPPPKYFCHYFTNGTGVKCFLVEDIVLATLQDLRERLKGLGGGGKWHQVGDIRHSWCTETPLAAIVGRRAADSVCARRRRRRTRNARGLLYWTTQIWLERTVSDDELGGEMVQGEPRPREPPSHIPTKFDRLCGFWLELSQKVFYFSCSEYLK